MKRKGRRNSLKKKEVAREKGRYEDDDVEVFEKAEGKVKTRVLFLNIKWPKI